MNIAGIQCDMSDSFGDEGCWNLKEEKAVYKQILLGVDKIPSTVKLGSKADDVKLLQTELNFAGYNCGTVDGIFGAKTDLAVKLYQKAASLAADGIVRSKTWTSLLTAYVVELSPSMLRAGLVSSAGIEIAKTVHNFINANFFSGKNTIGWLISDSKILCRRDEYKTWHGNPKGTLMIYKDGRVEVGQKYDSDIAPVTDTIQFACQGFDLPATGDVSASIKSEGFDPAEVGRRTDRLAIGYNGSKIIIAVQKLSDATRMRHTMELLGCAGRSMCLDSGGSVNLWTDGKAIFKTDRILTNIIYWG